MIEIANGIIIATHRSGSVSTVCSQHGATGAFHIPAKGC